MCKFLSLEAVTCVFVKGYMSRIAMDCPEITLGLGVGAVTSVIF